MRVAIYPRVSTIEQAKDGYSISEQIDRLTKYCESRGWTVHKVYTDAGYSGAKMDRPGLQALIEDAESKAFDAVLVYKLDRLSRSQKDTLSLIEDVFLANEIDFISLTENFDTSSAFGRAMVGILAVFAQLEREQIRERMSVGKLGRAKDGYWHGGKQTPVGYVYGGGELRVNEYEAAQVREMFELFGQRVAPHRIAKTFNRRGYTTRYGNWSGSKITNMVQNKTYLGLLKWDGEWYQGRHEPIITQEAFDKAALVLEDRRPGKRAAKRMTALGGLVECGWCGSDYFVKTRRTGSYYTCYKRSDYSGRWADVPSCERCRNKNFRVEELDEMVFESVRSLALDPDGFSVEERFDGDAAKVSAILGRMAEINAQLERLTDLYALGSIGFDRVKSRAEPLESEMKSLRAEVKRLEKPAKMKRDEAVVVANDLAEVIEKGDPEEVRGIVGELVERIVVDGDDVHIHWRFS